MHTQVAEMEFGEAIQVVINIILILIYHTGSTRTDLKKSRIPMVFINSSFEAGIISDPGVRHTISPTPHAV